MDTPRTDKEVELIESSEWEPRLVVSADFARSLEREIAELQQKIAERTRKIGILKNVKD